MVISVPAIFVSLLFVHMLHVRSPNEILLLLMLIEQIIFFCMCLLYLHSTSFIHCYNVPFSVIVRKMSYVLHETILVRIARDTDLWFLVSVFSLLFVDRLVFNLKVVSADMSDKVEQQLVADPAKGQFLFAKREVLPWWPDFQRRFHLITGVNSISIVGSKDELADATKVVETHLQAVVSSNFHVKCRSYEEIYKTYPVDRLKQMGSVTTTLILPCKFFVIRIIGYRRNIVATKKQLAQLHEIFQSQRWSHPPVIRQRSYSVPNSWMTHVNHVGYQKIQLAVDSDEFKRVADIITRQSPNSTVTQVERIENPNKYLQYQIHKDSVDVKLKSSTLPTFLIPIPVEKQLFHGTAEANIDGICRDGFNRSFCGQNGTVYGQGCYFSSDFNYSIRFTGGCKKIFLCDVTTGRYQVNQPNSTMKVLDFLPGSTVDRYDSAVNRHPFPHIFVTFNDNSAYPTYLITLA